MSRLLPCSHARGCVLRIVDHRSKLGLVEGKKVAQLPAALRRRKLRQNAHPKAGGARRLAVAFVAMENLREQVYM